MKNALIFTQNFPPTNVVSARRFGILSLHMSRFGWRPWIVTTNGTGPLDLPVDEATVIRCGRHAHQGHAAAKGNGKSSQLLTEFGKRCAGRLGLRYSVLTPATWQWYRSVRRRQTEIVRRIPHIDMVLGSFAPEHSFWLARRFSKATGAPWVADFRDLAGLYAPEERGCVLWLYRRLEKSLMQSASGVTTVSPTLAAALQDAYQRPTTVVYNGWDEADCQQPGDEEGTARPYPYLYYAGRLYPHRMPSVHVLLAAIRGRPNVRFVCRSLGPAQLERQILNHAEQLGIAHQVHIEPPADPPQIKRESIAALANVVVEDLHQVDPYTAGHLTGKFLKLLVLDPPVVCIARPDSDTGPILAKTGKGQLCHTAAELDRFLAAAMTDDHPFQGNQSAVEEYSSIEQARELCRAFDEIVTSSNRSFDRSTHDSSPTARAA